MKLLKYEGGEVCYIGVLTLSKCILCELNIPYQMFQVTCRRCSLFEFCLNSNINNTATTIDIEKSLE
jgi:hypothetical protein